MDGPSRRIAVITDSSRGIGAAIALLLADGGGSVAVRGRDAAVVDAIVDEIRWEGAEAIPCLDDAASADVEIVIVREVASQAA